ncbi:Asp23/Gls24 family envelope stress response protein [Williamsia sp. DF01-3]|uniref:Asp23/Gls24 family envelope stress response protein n=1 Tax=Williamsia sp. DF01-3 TaxID=2934157 RepID=UPI001FF6471B|nr:Asp23/Gls24 family envelope stress response protein [Williamsia sp. DF01-3]MCK0517427.1 Asp23/Gls24 family envelope stress response protein [Williamsia sp. DF01-3]
MTSTEAQVDQIAAVVTAVPGVAGLHAGMFGEVATYLPGRRVPGVRIADAGAIDVHVSVRIGAPIRDTAAAIRRAVSAVHDGAVNVTVEDVVPVGEGEGAKR